MIAQFCATATPNDLFTSVAGAAGYLNPNRLPKRLLPLFVEHSRRFFHEADMSIAPMVLDWDEPTQAVKDAFGQFAPDGFATIVMDLHEGRGKPPEPHAWKGMPVTELINEAWDFANPEATAEMVHHRVASRPADEPAFLIYRVVWTTPTEVFRVFDALKAKRPQARFELIDVQNFFRLLRMDLERRMKKGGGGRSVF